MKKAHGDGLAVHVLASGSKGNATLVTYKNTSILIDAGISCKRLIDGMKSVDVEPHSLKGIFLTHEHSDHVMGAPQFLKRFKVPIVTKKRTWLAMNHKFDDLDNCFVEIKKDVIKVGDLEIESFSTSHDAVDPVGFSCYGGNDKLTLLTDTGYVSETMMKHVDESNFLVLEFNHDMEMLRYGRYPLNLKRRVAGIKGHLNNEDAANVLLTMKRPINLQVVLAHRSEKNNTMKKIEQVLCNKFAGEGIRIGKDINIFHGQPKQTVSMRAKENGR